jgi:hypothetical protein
MYLKTSDAFEIGFVFLAYVPPFEKESGRVEIQTLTLKTQSKTTEYLFKIFDSAMNAAKVEILFNADEKQFNPIRNEILSITQKETHSHKLPHAKKLARRLHEETDGRNGNGLFAIIEGKKARTTRMVLLRFKGAEGLANHGKKMNIDYIPEVFTKKTNHYKLAVYEDIVSTKAFWKGYSVDKQITANQIKSVSYFWVESFLNSKTALTPAQGTLQFSKIFKGILSKSLSLDEQEELITGIQNLQKKKNIQISVAQFCNIYLSKPLADRVREETANEDFFNSVFVVDDTIYKKEFGRTVLSIEGGITAFVPTFQYDKHVTETLENDGTKNIHIHGKLSAKKINTQLKEKVKQVKQAPKKKVVQG